MSDFSRAPHIQQGKSTQPAGMKIIVETVAGLRSLSIRCRLVLSTTWAGITAVQGVQLAACLQHCSQIIGTVFQKERQAHDFRCKIMGNSESFLEVNWKYNKGAACVMCMRKGIDAPFSVACRG